MWGSENEPNEEMKIKYSLLNIWKLTLTRNEATQSNVGPRLAVNPTLRNFNLRLKIEKIINIHKGSLQKKNKKNVTNVTIGGGGGGGGPGDKMLHFQKLCLKSLLGHSESFW